MMYIDIDILFQVCDGRADHVTIMMEAIELRELTAVLDIAYCKMNQE